MGANGKEQEPEAADPFSSRRRMAGAETSMMMRLRLLAELFPVLSFCHLASAAVVLWRDHPRLAPWEPLPWAVLQLLLPALPLMIPAKWRGRSSVLRYRRWSAAIVLAGTAWALMVARLALSGASSGAHAGAWIAVAPAVSTVLLATIDRLLAACYALPAMLAVAAVLAGKGGGVSFLPAMTGSAILFLSAALAGWLAGEALLRAGATEARSGGRRAPGEAPGSRDSLTGLADRRWFERVLRRSVRRAARQKRTLALLLVDLEAFSSINHNLGHAAGDRLLIRVAQRLRENVRGQDVVARLGSDEFGLLLRHLYDRQSALDILDRIASLFAVPFRVDGRRLEVRGRIGAALYPDHAATPQQLMLRANFALAEARRRPHLPVSVFSSDSYVERRHRSALRHDLERAFEAGELVVHLQPQLRARDGRVVGAEALARWHHPERGVLPPDRFLGLIEERRLDLRFLRCCVEQAAAALEHLGDRLPRIGVNLSPHLLRDERLIAMIIEVLRNRDTDPGRLEFEITESAVLDTERAARALRALRDLGCRLAIDDFGTGYSNLARLRQLTLDAIKIDRLFVQDMLEDAGARALVEAILGMAGSLDLETVAEGVERPRQADLLRDLGCTTLQGFLFARPMPLASFTAWLERHEARQQATGADPHSGSTGAAAGLRPACPGITGGSAAP